MRARESRTQKLNGTEKLMWSITEHVELDLIERFQDITEGLASCPNIRTPECRSSNLFLMSSGNFSCDLCPLNFRKPLSKRRALTVYRATGPTGSNTEETKLKMVRWVIALSTGQSTHLLTTNLSFIGSHTKPKLMVVQQRNNFIWWSKLVFRNPRVPC